MKKTYCDKCKQEMDKVFPIHIITQISKLYGAAERQNFRLELCEPCAGGIAKIKCYVPSIQGQESIDPTPAERIYDSLCDIVAEIVEDHVGDG